MDNPMSTKVVRKTAPPNAGKGRKKGVPNRTTAALKDAILNAFTEVGGESYLVTVARNDPRTFCALLAKVLPMQLSSEDGAGLVINVVQRASTDLPRGREPLTVLTGVPRP
jgi:hypothetical protein